MRLFCNILQVRSCTSIPLFLADNSCTTDWQQHADQAQQAFLVATIPTLQHALPALEKLYASWEKAASKECYQHFVPALTAGMAKLDSYYQRSAKSDTHIIAMGDVFLFDLTLAFH